MIWKSAGWYSGKSLDVCPRIKFDLCARDDADDVDHHDGDFHQNIETSWVSWGTLIVKLQSLEDVWASVWGCESWLFLYWWGWPCWDRQPFSLYNRSGLDDSAGNLWKFAQGCQINASAGNLLMISTILVLETVMMSNNRWSSLGSVDDHDQGVDDHD